MAWDVTTGPGVTALGLAAARSVESGRPDRLIDDPFARALFGAAGADLPMLVDWPEPGDPVSDSHALHLHGSRYIGLRTRFYDDFLADGAAGGAAQGVLLGAGLDTRAFRLDLPAGFRLFELDQAGVLDYKAANVGAEPRCAHEPIGVDLREDWPAALAQHDFDSSAPTTWIAVGLLPYLPPEGQAELLGRITDLAAPGSTLAFDRIAGDPGAGGRLESLSERSGIDMSSLIEGGEGDDLAALLRSVGWEAEEETTTAVAGRYGRDLSDPFGGDDGTEPPWLDTLFLRARLAD